MTEIPVELTAVEVGPSETGAGDDLARYLGIRRSAASADVSRAVQRLSQTLATAAALIADASEIFAAFFVIPLARY